tara:strand:- start:2448 stop:4553 length:2106 start_codon:yes stop_codon:yes gene_type:complete
MSDDLYLTWSDDLEKSKAYQQSSDNIHAYDGIQKSYAYDNRTYIDVESSRSVRPSFYRNDYTAFRPGEAVPKQQKRIMKMCMQAYDKVGIVRNVIDLMGDFASQGLTLVHPNKSIERFYRKWFENVNGLDRSERFLNYLYRCGNVIAKRRTAKISKKKEAELKRSSAAPDMKIEDIPVSKREIPWKYDFLNPLAVGIKNSETAAFTGDLEYVLKVSKTTVNSLLMYNGREGNNKPLPAAMLKQFNGGEREIPLDREKVMMFHYKKDDWNMWANPMIYAILDDIIMLEKMKLADLAALDGAISNVRLWRIGDLDHKIIPTKAAINKLRDILASNVGGGTMDLVWGPEIDFKESSTQVYKFLGSEKYQPVLTSVYAGLGIPPTLTGAAGASGGYTNNYVSLKTLIERLEYGREILKQFWQHEIKLVQKAMGFRFPAEIHFDSIILSDEAAQKQLLVQLADRDIISHETLLERFRELPSIEKIRVRREERARVNDALSPKKAGPYHNPQHKDDIAKIALTKDIIDKDIYLNGLGLPPSEVDEINKLEEKSKQPPQEEKPDLVDPRGGRPLNSRDTGPRKQKRVLPRSGDSLAVTLWAYESQKTIAELVAPMALNHFNKKNARSLTKSEFDQLEYLKLCILTGMEPFMDIDESVIKSIIDSNTKPSATFKNNVKEAVASFVKNQKRKPNIDEMRYIYASTFAALA